MAAGTISFGCQKTPFRFLSFFNSHLKDCLHSRSVRRIVIYRIRNTEKKFNLTARVCHSHGHYLDYSPDALSFSQVTATHLKIRWAFHYNWRAP